MSVLVMTVNIFNEPKNNLLEKEDVYYEGIKTNILKSDKNFEACLEKYMAAKMVGFKKVLYISYSKLCSKMNQNFIIAFFLFCICSM